MNTDGVRQLEEGTCRTDLVDQISMATSETVHDDGNLDRERQLSLVSDLLVV